MNVLIITKTTTYYLNEYSSKIISSSFSDIKLDVPRYRKSQFKSKVIKKYETICNELDKKIIDKIVKAASEWQSRTLSKDIRRIIYTTNSLKDLIDN